MPLIPLLFDGGVDIVDRCRLPGRVLRWGIPLFRSGQCRELVDIYIDIDKHAMAIRLLDRRAGDRQCRW